MATYSEMRVGNASIDAAGASLALQAVPTGFLRSATTVSQVDEVYKYADRSG